MYNKQLNQELNDLRADAKKIRLMPNLTPDTRAAMLKIVILQQNLAKRQMIEQFKAYGVEP